MAIANISANSSQNTPDGKSTCACSYSTTRSGFMPFRRTTSISFSRAILTAVKLASSPLASTGRRCRCQNGRIKAFSPVALAASMSTEGRASTVFRSASAYPPNTQCWKLPKLRPPNTASAGPSCGDRRKPAQQTSTRCSGEPCPGWVGLVPRRIGGSGRPANPHRGS